MTVRELLARIDSHELSEWLAYYQIEPFGETRADMRAALIAMIMANIYRKKNQPPFNLGDFMFKFEPSKPQSVEEMKAICKSIANRMRHGGR